MKRIAVVAALALVTAAALIATVRIQPAGTARIVRRGDALRVIDSRVAFVIPGGSQCLAPSSGEFVRFDGAFDADDAGGETLGVAVRFDYAVPSRVPQEWADGNWCGALRSHVAAQVTKWIASADVESLRRDPRSAGQLAANALLEHLASQDVRTRSLTVRPRVPATALVTLPVAGIAAKTVKAPPVIFIGLDGADWQLLDAYMRAGAMPNLQSLVTEGTAGDLLTEHPPLSPLLWTTMMTGVSPLEHEVLDFTRFHPATGRKEPITSDERKVPAIWNMTTQAGRSAAVFGLWATYPAEPVRGLVLSDRFFTFLFSETAPPKGVVYPPSREAWARGMLAQVESDVDHAELAKYIPALTREEFDERRAAKDPYSHPVSALRRILVETAVYDRLARQYLESHSPDLTILYLQGTDSIGHVFAPYTAPRQPHISESDFARYSGVPERYFRSVDRIIGEYKSLAQRRGARLMLASDHGFHWFEGRPTELSSFAATTAAKWHRKAGIYVLWGAGIPAAGRTGREQHIAQVASTLLALEGLPQDTHLAAPPIVVAANPAIADYRTHFVPAKPVIENSMSNEAADEELAKLKALGYISGSEATSAPASLAGKSTRTAGWYNNRGLVLKDRKQMDAALEAFQQAIEIDPNLSSALWNYSDLLHLERRDLDRSDTMLVKAFATGLPEGRKFLIGRAIGYQRSGTPIRSLRLLEQAVAARPDDVELRLFRGRYRIEERDCAGALEDFRAAIAIDPRNPIPYASAGIAEVCLGRPEDARRSFARSLAIDSNQPRLQAFMQSQ